MYVLFPFPFTETNFILQSQRTKRFKIEWFIKIKLVRGRIFLKDTYSILPHFSSYTKRYSVSGRVPKKQNWTTISSELSPTISRSPLFSGNKVAPKRFQLSFDEYQKLKRKLRTLQRLAGLPFGAVALIASSCASAYMFPNMFDAPPEQIQPIL